MRKRHFIPSFLMSSFLLVNPVLAQTPLTETADPLAAEDTQGVAIVECQDHAWQTYDDAIHQGLKTFNDRWITEWRRQEDFRLKAAKTDATRAIRKRNLDQGQVTLQRALDALRTRQETVLGREKTETLETIPGMSEGMDDAFTRWANRASGASGIDGTVNAVQRLLLNYATVSDRRVITQVLNERRTRFWKEFTDTRSKARRAFVDQFNTCLQPAPDEESNSVMGPNGELIETPAQTPTPPTPAASDFRVTGVKLDVTPASANTCSQTYTFTGEITANKAGTAYFQWVMGTDSMEEGKVMIPESGVARVSKTVFRQGAYSGTMSIRVTSPTSVTSNQVRYDLLCTTVTPPTVTPPTVTTTQTTPSTSVFRATGVSAEVVISQCGKPVTTRGQISVAAQGTVEYYWEHSDGTKTTPKRILFTDEDPKTVTDEWVVNTSPAEGWVVLHVTAPNALTTDKAAFSFSCTIPFTVTAVRGEVKPASGICPVNAEFTGIITTSAAGTVQYHWEFSDGAVSDETYLPVKAAGEQRVTVQRLFNTDGKPWARLKVLNPTAMTSEPIGLSVACQSAQISAVTLSLDNPASYVCGMNNFTFSGSITATKPGTVEYRWERSDGAVSATQKLEFKSAETQKLSYTWSLGGNFDGYLRLHVLSPNDITSSPAIVSFKQSCQKSQGLMTLLW